MSRRRRLLYVVNDTPYFVLHWLERAVAAAAHGFDTHVAGSAGTAVDRVTSAGLAFHPVHFIRGAFRPATEARTLSRLNTLYRELQPDLVHHITIKPVIYGGLVSRLRKVPATVFTIPGLGYVFSQQGTAAALKREAVKIAYRRSLRHHRSRVIFENPDDRQDFLSWRLITSGQGLVIKGAGVDLDRFRPRATAAAGAPIVVMASRLLWDKGTAEFVEAAKRLKVSHPHARMVLVGAGDPDSPASVPNAQLQAWVDAGIIEWWGRRSDMPAVLAAAAIVTLPSFYREGIPRVLIEAAACGRPIVTTDTAGCREICQHGVNGLLVPPRNAAALAGALGALLDDERMRERMGKAGRSVTEAEYGAPRVIAHTLAVYDQLAPPGHS